MWFDSHCHLHLCDGSPEGLVAAARAAGVDQIVTIGIDVASSERALEIAEATGVYACVGVHPNSATEWNGEAASAIDSLAGNARVVAIGESGLDFYRDHAPHDVQRTVFRAHIALAKQHDKTLVIHTRESTSTALDELDGARPPERVVFHCWSGDRDDLNRALGLGAYISFAGNVSFNNAESLRDAARAVPDDRVLIETDAPFLTPMPHRGKRNVPAYVGHVGAAVAAARAIDEDALAALTTDNARTAFAVA